MGTHISKVKSIDLDMWTPEQMEVRLLVLVFLQTRPYLNSSSQSKNGEIIAAISTGKPILKQVMFHQTSAFQFSLALRPINKAL